MTDHEYTQDLDRIFVALANQHRREIVYALSLHPSAINQLAVRQGLSLPAIHKHIQLLEEAGMVIRKKIGRTNFLALNRKALIRLQDWANQYHAYWGSEEETLKNYARYLSTMPTSSKEKKK